MSHSPPSREHTASPTDASSSSKDSDCDPNEKPNLPYIKGRTFTAHLHEPPEPFGIGYDTERPPGHAGWKALSQVEYCLARPALEGRTDASVRKELTVTSTIRTGRDVGAQVVVVNGGMAKIFDAMYYAGLNECGYPEDVVVEADQDYSREAAAYRELQKHTEAAALVPRFHGTWTMEVETPIHQAPGTIVRAVRLILMELIVGDSMLDIDPTDLSEPLRSLILKQTLAAEAQLVDAGILHGDICPRNVIVTNLPSSPSDSIPSNVSIKIIDLNCAILTDHPQYADRKYISPPEVDASWTGKLPSPILLRYGDMMAFSCGGWCDNELDEPEKWLWEEFKDDERFAEVRWDPEEPDERPVYRVGSGK